MCEGRAVRRADHSAVGPAQLELIKPGARLVNCARGGIYDEAALVEGLTSGDFQVLEDGVEQKPMRFDLVTNLPIHAGIMVDTSAATAAGAYALTENSLYTVEALEDFMARLTPDGVVSIAS